MSNRQDLFRRIGGEKTPLIPWFGDLSYYYESLRLRGLLRPEYEGPRGEQKFYDDRRVGRCFYAPQTYTAEYLGDVTYESRRDGREIRSAFHTKYGTLTDTMKYLPGSYTYAYTEHLVKSAEDLKIMAHIYAQTRFRPNYAAFREADALYGEEGNATEICPISVSPVQTLLARWAGVEKTTELWCDESETFDACCAQIEEAQMPVFDVIAASGAKVTEFADNVSSEISGTFFEKYNLPYYQKVNRVLHGAGKFTGIHIDGTLNPLLGRLHEAGFDFAEAVTPAPVGDAAIEDLRRIAGPELFLWGGLPGAMFTPKFTDAQFEEQIRRFLRADDGKMILGVADQVPPDGIDERVRMVSRLIGRG